jgi:hypothetical protein
MELRYERKLSTNKYGSTYIAVPPAIVKAFKTKHICLIFDGECVRMEPSK